WGVNRRNTPRISRIYSDRPTPSLGQKTFMRWVLISIFPARMCTKFKVIC
ncbi:MAG: hypothetical protein, partial [Olavius algarvensis Delta 4 endosymbiont]